MPRRRIAAWAAFLVLWPIASLWTGSAVVSRHRAAADETVAALAALASRGPGWSVKAFASERRMWLDAELGRGLEQMTLPYLPIELVPTIPRGNRPAPPFHVRIGRRAFGRRLTYAALALDDAWRQLRVSQGSEQCEAEWISLCWTGPVVAIAVEWIGVLAFASAWVSARRRRLTEASWRA